MLNQYLRLEHVYASFEQGVDCRWRIVVSGMQFENMVRTYISLRSLQLLQLFKGANFFGFTGF
jgi:hypothetical protein